MENNTPQAPQNQAQGNDPSQDDLDIFVSSGAMIAAEVAKRIRGKASIDVLANALVDIIRKVEDKGAKEGIKFGYDIIIKGGTEILTHLLHLTQVDVKEEHVKAITAIAVGKYMQHAVKTGKISQDELQQLAAMKKGQPQPNQIPSGVSPSARQTQPQGLLGGTPNGR